MWLEECVVVQPAGWYDDGSGRLRWWDGSRWTDHVAPAPAGPAPVNVTANGGAPGGLKARPVPVFGLVSLGLAVLGTVLACIPATFLLGIFVLAGAFGMSVYGGLRLREGGSKWPAILGFTISILGVFIGVIVSLTVSNSATTTTPAPTPPAATEQPTDDPTGEGRPSPEEIADKLARINRGAGMTNYDDMPEYYPCMGQNLYNSDLADETIRLIIEGAESVGADDERASQVFTAAVKACDPKGEGAWG